MQVIMYYLNKSHEWMFMFLAKKTIFNISLLNYVYINIRNWYFSLLKRVDCIWPN